MGRCIILFLSSLSPCKASFLSSLSPCKASFFSVCYKEDLLNDTNLMKSTQAKIIFTIVLNLVVNHSIISN